MRLALPRTVMVLGAASLLNDVASEMITPILPLFLTATLGAGPAIVGLVEGIAQSTASVLKLVSGYLADRGVRHRRLILAGYGVSNLARPLIGFALGWGWVLALRFFDRVGKGVRTSPRDALMSASVSTAIRGRAFGFHRAMDHTGAMLGPLIAFVLLSSGLPMEQVFFASIVPGLLLMGLLYWGVPTAPPAVPVRPEPADSERQPLDTRLKAVLAAAGLLAVASVPDAFLILWASQSGIALAWIPLVWAAAHALRAVLAAVGGHVSDRAGRVPVVALGWLARVVMLLLLMQPAATPLLAWLFFLSYAATTALTEPVELALVGDVAPGAQRGTVFGLYHMVTGVLALPGALLFGVLWQTVGMATAFGVAAALTALSALALVVLCGSGFSRDSS